MSLASCCMHADGVVVACTYGQTELAGPVMFGLPSGDPAALRPLLSQGVSYELIRGAADGTDAPGSRNGHPSFLSVLSTSSKPFL